MKVIDNGTTQTFSGVSPQTTQVIDKVGPTGLTGPSGASTGFVHTQTTPSASWIITHNLNRYPPVTVIVDGEEVIADVIYVSLNAVNVVFAQAVPGLAILP